MQNQSPKVYGLTGVIGSGKSTVAELFERCGAYVIDADKLAREAVLPGSRGLAALSAAFGERVVGPTGELNRALVAELVFSDPTKRKQLETILHPLIRELFLAKLSGVRAKVPAVPLVLYVAPLLFEAARNLDELNGTIAVSSPPELCIERIMKRDHCSEEHARARLSSQMSNEQKTEKADFVIKNHGTTADLELQVSELYAELTKA